MATMDDIAKRLGISKGTVSKAFSGAEDVSEAMRRAVLETAVELGYTRQMRSMQAPKIAVFIENMSYEHPNDFGWDLVTGFRKLAVTGSTEVGLDVAKAAADKLIPATLELGGKSANIFFEDCDWDRALDGLQLGILFNQGQVCCAGSRVFVQEGIYDKFVEAAVKAFNSVTVGDPLDPNTQMGSQVDQGQLRKIMSYVELAKEEGATIACGGEPYKEGACAKGAFMKPTLIVNANNNMRVAQEEIFGPVAVVIKFKTEEEVIAMANDSVYGLGGAVWTQDINRAFRVARAIETGRMWVNTYNMIPAGAPFGGYKQSGIGRETHKVILEHYTQQKNIMINLNDTPSGFYPQK